MFTVNGERFQSSKQHSVNAMPSLLVTAISEDCRRSGGNLRQFATVFIFLAKLHHTFFLVSIFTVDTSKVVSRPSDNYFSGDAYCVLKIKSLNHIFYIK